MTRGEKRRLRSMRLLARLVPARELAGIITMVDAGHWTRAEGHMMTQQIADREAAKLGWIPREPR